MAITSEKRTGRRFLRRPVCLAAIGLVMSVGAVSALAAVVLQARPAAGSATAISVQAEPSSRTVAPGATARYALSIAKAHSARISLGGLTALTVASDGLPDGAEISFSPERGVAFSRPLRQRTTLTVTTAAGTPPGTYTLTVQVQRRHRSGSTAVRLIVSPPGGMGVSPPTSAPESGPSLRAPEAFTIAGSVSVALTPGTGQRLDLTLTSFESFDLSVSSLAVEVSSVSAPESDPSHACGTDDFSVQQFSGAPGFTLPAMSTVSLSALGFEASELPLVSMLNRPVNQDGCKAASFSLAFSGTATEVTP
jgi:hypothetical protein